MNSTQFVDKHKFNKGRPIQVSQRQERIILQEIHILREEFRSFIIKRRQLVFGLGNTVCNKTQKFIKKEAAKFLFSNKKDY